jgi:Flp pilus assembly protein TadB
VKAVAGAKNVDRRKQATEIAALKRRQSTAEALKELSNNEKQSRKRRVSVKGQIAQAGLSITPTMFWAASAGVGLVFGIIGFVIQSGATNPLFMYLAGGGFFVGFLGLPRWVLGMFVGWSSEEIRQPTRRRDRRHRARREVRPAAQSMHAHHRGGKPRAAACGIPIARR